ncbi:MAG: sigma-70 family RNA polymerase sigma factor [Pseudolabrys sp.]|nr:sigma-70 family RNA polymerase sigma factor [Pseudolabrys sp.]MCW5696127.1 sigma-70 family RNA polymerase sigma factor [Bauldia sp.]
MTGAIRDQMLAAIPSLRAFAVSLGGTRGWADDLVQETLTRAWANQHSFRPGTNLTAWLFTILRNEFYTQLRKRRREVEDADDAYAQQLATPPSQGGHMDLVDFGKALAELPAEQREALILTGGSGFSYEEAAEICGCAVGTIKSRVNRARATLSGKLKLDETDTFGLDGATIGIVAGGPR